MSLRLAVKELSKSEQFLTVAAQVLIAAPELAFDLRSQLLLFREVVLRLLELKGLVPRTKIEKHLGTLQNDAAYGDREGDHGGGRRAGNVDVCGGPVENVEPSGADQAGLGEASRETGLHGASTHRRESTGPRQTCEM